MSNGSLHLSGAFVVALDAKGRVSIPAKFREQMVAAGGDELRLTRAITEPCLKLYSASAWFAVERAILDRVANPVERQALRRAIIGGTHAVALDGQGRILLPAELRQHASLDHEVKVVGDIDHVQLWQPRAWDDAYVASIDTVRGATSLLAEIGF